MIQSSFHWRNFVLFLLAYTNEHNTLLLSTFTSVVQRFYFFLIFAEFQADPTVG